jgi:hypothetical protein
MILGLHQFTTWNALDSERWGLSKIVTHRAYGAVRLACLRTLEMADYLVASGLSQPECGQYIALDLVFMQQIGD